MAYGKVSETFWTDHRVRAMSENARYMELYLRTAPHRNRLGLFVLDPNYATGDLQWPVEQVGSVFEELEQVGRIKWDHGARVVFVCDTLDVETLDNKNVVKGALHDLETVPQTVLLTELLKSVKSNFRDHYTPLVEKLEERVGNEEKTAPIKGSNGYPNHSPNGSGTQALPSPASTSPKHSSQALPSLGAGEMKKNKCGTLSGRSFSTSGIRVAKKSNSRMVGQSAWERSMGMCSNSLRLTVRRRQSVR